MQKKKEFCQNSIWGTGVGGRKGEEVITSFRIEKIVGRRPKENKTLIKVEEVVPTTSRKKREGKNNSRAAERLEDLWPEKERKRVRNENGGKRERPQLSNQRERLTFWPQRVYRHPLRQMT